MIDPSAQARSHLAADAAISGAGLQVYVGDFPPEEWDPAGEAAVVKSRGGPVRYDRLLAVSLQIKVYGPDQVAAWDAYSLVHDALDEKRSVNVFWSQIAVSGQLLREPATGRAFVLAYADLVLRNP